MADNDAKITVALDASKAIKEAQKAGPELEKALSIQINLKNASQSDRVFDRMQKKLRGNVEELAVYDKKLDKIVAKTEKLKELEQKGPTTLTPSEKGLLTIKANNKKGAYSEEESRAAKETLANYNAAQKLKNEIVRDIEKLDKTPEEIKSQAEGLHGELEKVQKASKDITVEQTAEVKKQSELVEKTKATKQEQQKAADAAKKEETAATQSAKATAKKAKAAKEAAAETKNTQKAEEQTTKATDKTTDSTKRSTKAKKEETEAIKENINAEKQLGEESKKTESKKKGSKTSSSKKSKKEDVNTAEGAESRTNHIKALVSEINTLKGAGEDTTKQFQELEQILGTNLGDQSIADLTRHFIDLDETIKYIKNDLDMSDLLDQEFGALFERLEQVRQKINEVKKDARSSDEPVKDAAQEIEETIQKVNATVESIPQMKFETSFDAKQNLDALKAAQKSIVDMGMPEALAEQYNKLDATIKAGTQAQKDFNKAAGQPTKEQKLKEFQDAMQRVIDTTDRVENAMRFDGAEKNIAELTRRLEELRNAKKVLEDFGLPREMDSRYDLLIRLIATTEQQIRSYKASVNETAAAEENAGNSSKNMGAKMKKGMGGIPGIINAVKKGFSSLSGLTNKVKSSFDGMARNMRSNFKHMLTNITKYVFGFRSLFFLVRRMRKYIGEGIKNMAQFRKGNNDVNRKISSLIQSLTFLKNAWATVFSPILSFVTPMLTALIDKLAQVGNAVSRFLGSLLGVGKVFQAVKAPAKNYAKSLDKAGGGAGKAAKKQKKLNDRIAEFDDLILLGRDKDNDKNNGSGSGNNDDKNKDDPNKMFKLIKVGKEALKKLKEMWKNADFTDLGIALRDSIVGALDKIDWEKTKAVANKIGKSLATFLNGVLQDGTLFAELGNFVAQGLNTIGSLINGFFEKYEKGSIGSSLAKFFQTAFENFDWNTAGANLGQLVTTFFTELATLFREFPTEEFIGGLEDFLNGVDWGAVVSSLFAFLAASMSLVGKITAGISNIISNIKAEDIAAAFENVDWDAVASGFGDLLGGALTSVFASIKFGLTLAKAICMGLANSWDKFAEGLGDFKSGKIWEGILKMGGALVSGLAQGIGDAFANAVEWVADHLAKPIVDGFTSLFKINSPSKVTEEWGTFLIEGLANGLAAGIANIKQKWEDIKGAIKEKVDNIKSDLSLAWDNIKSNMETKFGLIKDKVIEIWNGIKDGLKKPVNGIISIVESCINKMISGINAIAKKLNDLPSLEFKNPFTGKDYKLGFKIPELSKVSIPRLAQGAVIPPNKEFMAMLGDQSHGTNIEAPLDTIKQAVAEVMANNGSAEMIQLLQELITVVEHKNLVIGDKEIGRANARYNKQQSIVRGTSF